MICFINRNYISLLRITNSPTKRCPNPFLAKAVSSQEIVRKAFSAERSIQSFLIH